MNDLMEQNEAEAAGAWNIYEISESRRSRELEMCKRLHASISMCSLRGYTKCR